MILQKLNFPLSGWKIYGCDFLNFPRGEWKIFGVYPIYAFLLLTLPPMCDTLSTVA